MRARALAGLFVAVLLLSACRNGPSRGPGGMPRGHASPEAAVLTTSGHSAGGATVQSTATLPSGTLVLYTYQQHGQCGFGYGLASQRQGQWLVHASGSREGICQGTSSGPAVSILIALPPGLAIGTVGNSDIASVVVEWDDGTTVPATISQSAYFAYHAAAAEAVAATAYDADGNSLATVTRPFVPGRNAP